MKKWHDLLPNWAIIVMLTLIVTVNIISSYFGFSLLSKVAALAIIPVLLLSYFYRQRFMANIFYTIFILYFLGMLFNALDHLALSSKLSESCFLAVYVLLGFVMIGKVKDVKFEGLVSMYLILILLVNSYFMYIMFSSVQDSFADSVNFTLSVSKGIALLLMSFLAFAIYLSRETSQSIIFLTIVCCFVFSDVLSFITTMYVNFWLFEAVQQILQGAGLLLFCIYVYNHHKVENNFIKTKAEPVSQSNQIPVQS